MGVDYTVDDIIKLNKRQRGSSGRGRGRGRGRGKPSQQGLMATAATAKPGGLVQKMWRGKTRGGGAVSYGRRQQVQRLKQKAKKTVQAKKTQQQDSQATPGVKVRLGTRGRGRGMKSMRSDGAQQTPGVKVRLGTRGRGRGMKSMHSGGAQQTPGVKVRLGPKGRGRGMKSDEMQQTPGTRPGLKLKAIRYIHHDLLSTDSAYTVMMCYTVLQGFKGCKGWEKRSTGGHWSWGPERHLETGIGAWQG